MMKSKESSGKTKKRLVKKIDFITTLSQDDCIQRLFAARGKPVFAKKAIDVVTIDNRFIISVRGLLPSDTTNAPVNPRTVREAQCVGRLEPVKNGTRVVAEADFYAEYTPPQRSKLEILIEFVISVIMVSIEGSRYWIGRKSPQYGHPPDFAQWLYELLFELETGSSESSVTTAEAEAINHQEPKTIDR